MCPLVHGSESQELVELNSSSGACSKFVIDVVDIGVVGKVLVTAVVDVVGAVVVIVVLVIGIVVVVKQFGYMQIHS